jgi:hypothetical protein
MDERDRRYNERFDAQEKAVEAALASSEKAVLKAETASERRFEGVNEFRATLSDQAATFITRKEVDAELGAQSEKLNIQQSRLDRIEARSAGLNAGWILVVQAGTLVGVVVAIVLALR